MNKINTSFLPTYVQSTKISSLKKGKQKQTCC